MSPPTPIQMSQGLEVLQPKSAAAYPISCDEWRHLKRQLSDISGAPFILVNVGSILIGASIATAIGILTDSIPNSNAGSTKVAWVITFATLFCGIVAFLFSKLREKVRRKQVEDVIAQMELIESRYHQKTAANYPADGDEVQSTN